MIEYDSAFYDKVAETARSSARHIVPIIIASLKPKSVIDIGCGTGTWLSVFEENGIFDFLGVDANFIPRDALEIPSAKYLTFDLSLPFKCERKFDLVISLEVAEHLPAHCAESFVASLIHLGSAVLFSAAIPGQGGTNHVNEQWQDYWAGLFGLHNYVPVDFLRGIVWENREVAWWYSQNALLYCERNYANTSVIRKLTRAANLPLRLVHPRKFQEAVWRERLARAAFELTRVMPPGSKFLLIDGGTAGTAFDCCGRAIPFPQREGVFAGNPPDSRAALAEMNSLKPAATHVVILESAFWWMSYYSAWFDELMASSTPLIDTDMIKIFRFNSNPQR